MKPFVTKGAGVNTAVEFNRSVVCIVCMYCLYCMYCMYCMYVREQVRPQLDTIGPFRALLDVTLDNIHVIYTHSIYI